MTGNAFDEHLPGRATHEPAQLEVDRGEVAFMGPLRFEPTTVNHIEGLWMRGRLAEVIVRTSFPVDRFPNRLLRNLL